MHKIGKAICKYRRIILAIALLLIIPALIGMKATKINYDILVYLPSDVETIQGENILSNDFNMGAFSVIILEDMQTKDILKLEDKIKEVPNVEKVISIADVIGTSIPTEMLPDKLKDKIYKDNSTIMLVTFKDQISADSTMEAVETLRDITDERCKISGMTSTVLDTRNLSNSEIAIYVVIAVILCLIVLEIALDSYIAPILLLLNIGIAILYNMGTNIFLGEISYITKAISAVLQLGVTMDFAIFLYHSYMQEKENFESNEDAMASAIHKTLLSVVGSSLTTIAGFLALCSMNLTLGRDIGIVMAKGVFCGVVCVLTVLPAMILNLNGLIEKTKHKEILPKFEGVKNFVVKHYKAIILVFIVLLPIAFYGYSHTENYYNLDKSLPKTLDSVIANTELKEKFNMVSMELLLVDKDLPDSTVNKMLDEIEELDGIEWALGFSKVSSLGIPREMIPEEAIDVFQNDEYQMIIINSNYEMATNELNAQVTKVNEIIKKYDENAILAGEGPLMKDLVEISDHDFNSVNSVSIVIIFIIMIVVLKSISLPVILIIVIEFAIFINMGIPYYTNTILPFIASIVIGTIQLGATIDYAILITNKYITSRKDGIDKKAAVSEALGTSIGSILISGLCFFGATFGVGAYSKIEMIGSLCTLMSRGAIVSVFCVVLILPSLLMAFDKLICKTTMGMKKKGLINNE
ncbi:MAG: MMPL family transporter [Clostridia bacterium]|nr:MMPL family transporter [Clostridia bacterium]MCI8833112.1 MMPL family transporter [Clostridia bacterium]